MNAISRIQVEFDKPAAQVRIPVKCASATASRVPGAEVMVSRTKPGSFTKVVGANDRSVESKQFIERIREVLRKQGM